MYLFPKVGVMSNETVSNYASIYASPDDVDLVMN